MFLYEGFLQLWQAGATLHRGARASHYRGLSCCGAQAPDAQAQQSWLTGLVAPRHVGSSQTRARTRVPCVGRQILNHCATMEAQKWTLLLSSFYREKTKAQRSEGICPRSHSQEVAGGRWDSSHVWLQGLNSACTVYTPFWSETIPLWSSSQGIWARRQMRGWMLTQLGGLVSGWRTTFRQCWRMNSECLGG